MSDLSEIKKIAITGGIGTGKSTLKKIIEEMGYSVFDADQCVANLYQNNEDLIKEFRQHFPYVVDDVGVNKSKLRKLLIEQPDFKQKVEQLVHPKVLEELLVFFKSNASQIVFAEIPLLFEVNWQNYFDEVWCVYASKDLIIKRLMDNRGLNEEIIRSMLNWQMNPQKKCAMSTFVLYNDKGIDYLKNQVIQRLNQTESRKSCIK